jgi:hypothetical protein
VTKERTLNCDICGFSEGVTDEDHLIIGFGARTTDLDGLLGMVYHEGPRIPLWACLTVMCPAHADDEYVNAGYIPPGMIDTLPGVRESLNKWLTMEQERLSA